MTAYPTGLCTWSLKNNPFDVFQTLEETGLSLIHLELVALELFRKAIAEKRCSISCTMLAFPQEDYSTLESIRHTGGIVPDECWPLNRALVLDAIEKTATLKVDLLSFHAGFIDHTDAETYQRFLNRIKELADAAQEKDLVLLLETGQESASELRTFLETLNHPALGVNFDPANIILYGKGNPIDAVHTLASWIKHVHIKDAVPSATPGEWGSEVRWGDGKVGAVAFIEALQAIHYSGALAIERESGEQRIEDIKTAANRLKNLR